MIFVYKSEFYRTSTKNINSWTWFTMRIAMDSKTAMWWNNLTLLHRIFLHDVKQMNIRWIIILFISIRNELNYQHSYEMEILMWQIHQQYVYVLYKPNNWLYHFNRLAERQNRSPTLYEHEAHAHRAHTYTRDVDRSSSSRNSDFELARITKTITPSSKWLRKKITTQLKIQMAAR